MYPYGQDGSSSSPWSNPPPAPIHTRGHRPRSGAMTSLQNSSSSSSAFSSGCPLQPQALSPGPHRPRSRVYSQNLSLTASSDRFAGQQDPFQQAQAMSRNFMDINSSQYYPCVARNQINGNGLFEPNGFQPQDVNAGTSRQFEDSQGYSGIPLDADYHNGVVPYENHPGVEPSGSGGPDGDNIQLSDEAVSNRVLPVDYFNEHVEPWSVFQSSAYQGPTEGMGRLNPFFYGGTTGSDTSGDAMMTRSTEITSELSPSDGDSTGEVPDWMQNSQDTLIPDNIGSHSINSGQQPPQNYQRPLEWAGANGIRFQVRESTPVSQMSGSHQAQNFSSARSPLESNNYLRIPPRSRSNSVVSSASSTASEPHRCGHCGKVYRGAYSRGNLARHVRLKHGATVVVYCCEETGCDREFFRQDARLKHYRKHHNHLALRRTSG